MKRPLGVILLGVVVLLAGLALTAVSAFALAVELLVITGHTPPDWHISGLFPVQDVFWLTAQLALGIAGLVSGLGLLLRAWAWAAAAATASACLGSSACPILTTRAAMACALAQARHAPGNSARSRRAKRSLPRPGWMAIAGCGGAILATHTHQAKTRREETPCGMIKYHTFSSQESPHVDSNTSKYHFAENSHHHG